MDSRSIHLMAEYLDCDSSLLDDPDRVVALLREAARAAGVTVVGALEHRYTPQGVAAVLLLQESHLSIHTWPELGYAAVDFFTCGPGQPERAAHVIERGLGAARCELLLVRRGELARTPSLKVMEPGG